MTPETVVIEAVRAGVLLIPVGDRLQFKALRPVAPALRERITANKSSIWELLTSDRHDVHDARAPAYTPAERALLARARPGLRATVDRIKATFADLPFGGVTVIGLASDPHGPRAQAARLIRQARRRDRGRAVALRDGWRERVAICCIDGGLTEHEAERVAWQEIAPDLVEVKS